VINFTNIYIEELVIFYNQYDKPLFFDCFFCGLAEGAYYVISRTNRDGHILNDYACPRCADIWREDCKRLGVPYNVYQTSFLNPDDYYEQPERKWTIDDALDVLFGVKQ
jgi:predicted RNA-binding Zn-ribbon protein involved in translation (DUF1610 family)